MAPNRRAYSNDNANASSKTQTEDLATTAAVEIDEETENCKLAILTLLDTNKMNSNSRVTNY